MSPIEDGEDDICKSSKSIWPSSTKILNCFRADSNSGANNLTFSRNVFAVGIENLELSAKLYFSRNDSSNT